MQAANPLWGAPRIHGELRKLGIAVAQTTVANDVRRHRRTPPSQTWRTFLSNHVAQFASIDFFTVPTATFRVLCVFVVLAYDRRRVVHLNVTAHPTAAWTAQQLREAWPDDTAPRFLLRDRDAIDGLESRRTAAAMGFEEIVTAPRAPWQNPFVERLVGSLRRECLDHVIIWNAATLRRCPQQSLSLLPPLAHSPLAREGCARPTAHSTTDRRHHRTGCAPWWVARPRRAPGRLTAVRPSADEPGTRGVICRRATVDQLRWAPARWPGAWARSCRSPSLAIPASSRDGRSFRHAQDIVRMLADMTGRSTEPPDV